MIFIKLFIILLGCCFEFATGIASPTSALQAIKSPRKISLFTERELDNTEVPITIVFKPNAHIPSDEVLNEVLPLEKHVGPFGRRFVASARQIKNALKLAGFDHWQTVAGEKFYAAAGRPTLPPAWAEGVRGILGLDTRPLAKRKKSKVNILGKVDEIDQNGPIAPWPPIGFFPPQVAEIYGFPRGGLGQGQKIGLLESPGGYYYEDIVRYFQYLGIPETPKVTFVSVDGGINNPTNPDNDSEIYIDILTAADGCIARLSFVYITPDSLTQSLYNGLAGMLRMACPLYRFLLGYPK